MNDFEARLKKLRLVEPSRQYIAHANGPVQPPESRRPVGATAILAACLALSLFANLYLIGLDESPSPENEVPGEASVTIQIQDIYVPGTENAPQLRVKERS
jgi:hypothetical protein